MPQGLAQTAAAKPKPKPKPGSLQPMARRAPAARACQPPPLLMDSATCSTDTRCSAQAGRLPGGWPSTRPQHRAAVVQRESGREAQAQRDNAEQLPQLESVRLQPVPPLSPTRSGPSLGSLQLPTAPPLPGTQTVQLDYSALEKKSISSPPSWLGDHIQGCTGATPNTVFGGSSWQCSRDHTLHAETPVRKRGHCRVLEAAQHTLPLGKRRAICKPGLKKTVCQVRAAESPVTGSQGGIIIRASDGSEHSVLAQSARRKGTPRIKAKTVRTTSGAWQRQLLKPNQLCAPLPPDPTGSPSKSPSILAPCEVDGTGLRCTEAFGQSELLHAAATAHRGVAHPGASWQGEGGDSRHCLQRQRAHILAKIWL